VKIIVANCGRICYDEAKARAYYVWEVRVMDKEDDMEMTITMEDRIRAARYIQHKTLPSLQRSFVNLAELYMESGNYAEALRYYNKVLQTFEGLTPKQQDAALAALAYLSVARKEATNHAA